MTFRWRNELEVARWEFLRFVKPKQHIAGILVTMIMAGAVIGLARMASGGDDRVREIAVIGMENLSSVEAGTSFRFSKRSPSEETTLRAEIRDQAIDGLLLIHSPDSVTLVAAGRGGDWEDELQATLTAARQQHMTERAGLSPDALARILRAPAFEVEYESQRARGRGERIALVVVVGLMLFAVFVGMSYIFASITGEKQLRVTEQVMSAIPAQAWIDGKILGLIAVSIIGVLAQVIAFGAVFAIANRFFDGPSLPLPDSSGDPIIIGLILVYAVLGLFLWFSFLGAIAAMIDDPHSSTRGSLLFVPMMASCMAFFILGDTGSGFARALSLVPLTSISAMPVRLLNGDVPATEVAISMVLLIAGVLLLRIAAGRVFRLAMLMYGKEPTWAEVWRWMVSR